MSNRLLGEGLSRVTRAEPCAVCGRPDWCCRLNRWNWCMRIESTKPHPKGGWLHAREGIQTLAPLPPPPRRASDLELRERWEPIAERAHRNGLDRMASLAVQLRVKPSALSALRVGYMNEIGFGPECWTFPERNPDGLVVGLLRRIVNPEGGNGKLFCKGSRRGLVFCNDWHKTPGTIYLVEGPTDVAAMLSAGLCAVGRPSNVGGVQMLAKLLESFRSRPICVVGENDRKDTVADTSHPAKCPGCQRCWPGKYGAKQTARELAGKLHRSIRVLMPPKQFKDVRDWYASGTLLGKSLPAIG